MPVRQTLQAVGRLLLGILAAIVLIFGLALMATYFVAGLIVAIGAVLIWPPVADRIGRLTGRRWLGPVAGLVTAVLIAPVVTVMTAPSAEEVAALAAEKAAKEVAQTEAKKAEEKAAIQAREARWAQEQAEIAAKREAEAKAELALYIKRLDTEIASISDVKVSTYTSGIVPINAGLALIGAWAVFYEKGGRLDLNADAEAKRQTFRSLIVKKQSQMLPAMRDAYGPAMRQELWEADGSAKTFGNGFKTVEFVSAAFARNANIKKINDQMYEMLMALRFTRAQYKWFSGATEYSYYTLYPPKDTNLVRWNSNGSFQLLD